MYRFTDEDGKDEPALFRADDPIEFVKENWNRLCQIGGNQNVKDLKVRVSEYSNRTLDANDVSNRHIVELLCSGIYCTGIEPVQEFMYVQEELPTTRFGLDLLDLLKKGLSPNSSSYKDSCLKFSWVLRTNYNHFYSFICHDSTFPEALTRLLLGWKAYRPCNSPPDIFSFLEGVYAMGGCWGCRAFKDWNYKTLQDFVDDLYLLFVEGVNFPIEINPCINFQN